MRSLTICHCNSWSKILFHPCTVNFFLLNDFIKTIIIEVISCFLCQFLPKSSKYLCFKRVQDPWLCKCMFMEYSFQD